MTYQFGVPVIVSPTTTRAGYKTRNVVKSSYETIPGDGAFVGKYDIPEVDLPKCSEKLDFACLLAIGTTPIEIQSKQLDGLDKSTNVRLVRPTGTARYDHKSGAITRSQIQLITSVLSFAPLQSEIKVFFGGVAQFETFEWNINVNVKFDGLSFSSEIEKTVQVSVKFGGSLVASEVETSNTISVKMDNKLVSNTNEG